MYTQVEAYTFLSLVFWHMELVLDDDELHGGSLVGDMVPLLNVLQVAHKQALEWPRT